MKTIIFCTVLFCAASFSKAQNDTIFPNVSASWNVQTYTNDSGNDYYAGYSCEILNDTIDSLGYFWSTMIDGSLDTIGWVAIDSGKVYYKGINPIGTGLGHVYDGDTVIVIYDFNLQIGDTAYFQDGIALVVEDISTTNFLGVPKRTFQIGGFGYYDSWVEGIGSTEGFFRPVFSTFELSMTLCSFNGEYKDSLGMSYNLNYDNHSQCELAIDEIQSYVKIKTGEDWVEIEVDEKNEFMIFSTGGNLIEQIILSEGYNKIDLRYLSEGFYIFSVGDLTSTKFIKR